ncbi:LLM class flavin-dependent oxidoreductase [Tessaracoccus rhinocerotis]|uniref:LLM class flavin-dependent oxidoreductase n=1 Tax=Tessaracoccus rhinocerotis TaxID=1689449 RepID=A0A553K208_9ACTN|nr:LLM class flavin-dependent oxidoreductase [Tessaracoccus rhinocerotis]TRY18737.1 LLM class flavin-dependent oxidoreductase [Tessaracoccus rhinocerotis]
MKKIGFLSFGHYRAPVSTAGSTLRQHVEMARAADELGFDGAWLRVHHFEQTLSSPFPLLSAMAAVTTRLDVGTGVVDLRYENPLYMAEEAAATDLISDGRLQLGVSRGSPEHAADGQEQFGQVLAEGESWSQHARGKLDTFRRAIAGEPVARSHVAMQNGDGPDLPVRPLSEGLGDRIWWGAGTHATGVWAGEQGLNLLSSTLLLDEDGRPFHVQQADQVRAHREAFAAAGHTGGGRAAVTRPAFPITSDVDQRYFGLHGGTGDAVGVLDNTRARSGPEMAGSVEEVVAMLRADDAVAEADYVLFACPSQLGLDYVVHWMGNLVTVARELGWK